MYFWSRRCSGLSARPELTAEKFVINPWARAGFQEDRLYRTGDLACISADGQIHCLGRTDDQVKIRGFRVELGEIEAVLAKQKGVATVAVILQQESGIDHLTAYIVAEAGFELQHSQLRSALIAVLPPYMVPGRFELLDEMPRLNSGKIDRKTLKSRMIASQTILADSSASDQASTEAEHVLFSALQNYSQVILSAGKWIF